MDEARTHTRTHADHTNTHTHKTTACFSFTIVNTRIPILSAFQFHASYRMQDGSEKVYDGRYIFSVAMYISKIYVYMYNLLYIHIMYMCSIVYIIIYFTMYIEHYTSMESLPSSQYLDGSAKHRLTCCTLNSLAFFGTASISIYTIKSKIRIPTSKS